MLLYVFLKSWNDRSCISLSNALIFVILSAHEYLNLGRPFWSETTLIILDNLFRFFFILDNMQFEKFLKVTLKKAIRRYLLQSFLFPYLWIGQITAVFSTLLIFFQLFKPHKSIFIISEQLLLPLSLNAPTECRPGYLFFNILIYIFISSWQPRIFWLK